MDGSTVTFIDVTITGVTTPTIQTRTGLCDRVTGCGVGCDTAAGLGTVISPFPFWTYCNIVKCRTTDALLDQRVS